MVKNLQKKLSIVSARTLNLFRESPKERIFYLHIPKCGGTSLNNALQACFLNWSLSDTSNMFNLDSSASWETMEKNHGLNLLPNVVNDYPVMQFRQEVLTYYMCQKHIDYISGHFLFSSHLYNYFSSKYSFITILRNPIKRWISSYFYNKNRQPSKYRKLDNVGIEDYLSSDYGKSQGFEYSKFLGGADQQGEFMTMESVSKAKENLSKFRLVGFLEDMENFVDGFYKHFGRQLKIGYMNQKSSSEAEEITLIENKYYEKIYSICKYDLEIYNYAIENFYSSNKSRLKVD